MKIIELKKTEHNYKQGEQCSEIAPNMLDDCFFYEEGKIIGFYIKSLSEYSKRANEFAKIANIEFRSKRVPKSEMRRNQTDGIDEKTGKYKYKNVVAQFSTILGGVPPKPHMKRDYATISSVHSVQSAQVFVKSMLGLCLEAEGIIKTISQDLFEAQNEALKDVPKKWRFGNLFTSSISNYNIAAAYHRDAGNIVGACNVIITKRENATGGNLHVPDYSAVMDSCDNSMLVYPAWKNLHGVTPIVPTKEGGYRNSLVFYPLKAFVGLK